MREEAGEKKKKEKPRPKRCQCGRKIGHKPPCRGYRIPGSSEDLAEKVGTARDRRGRDPIPRPAKKTKAPEVALPPAPSFPAVSAPAAPAAPSKRHKNPYDDPTYRPELVGFERQMRRDKYQGFVDAREEPVRASVEEE